MLPALINSAANDRTIKFDLPGDIQDVKFCDGTCTHAKPLDTQSGGGKWMYDETARSFGYDPASARQNPAQDAKVKARLASVIEQILADYKGGGVASYNNHFRASLGQVARIQEQAETRVLQEQQARLAALPGASIMANPAVQATARTILAAEQKVLSVVNPKMAKTVDLSVKAGAAIAMGASAFVEADKAAKTAGPDSKTGHSPQDETKKPHASPAAAALDLDKDGKLQCHEIGSWQPDMGRHSANSRAYQDYISGKPGTDFQVTSKISGQSVKFDGCKDTHMGAVLLEAKADQKVMQQSFFSKEDAIENQGRNQAKVAESLSVRNEWHTQMQADQQSIKQIFNDAGLTTPVIHTPMEPVK